MQNTPMIYGYARVSTDGRSVAAQVAALRKQGAGNVFREVAGDRAQLRRLLDQLDAGDVLMVTRLDRLARSTRDLLNTLAAITAKKAGFRSLGDAWADTTTAHGRLMLTVLGGLVEFEKELFRTRTSEGRERARVKLGRTEADRMPKARGDSPPRPERRDTPRDRPQLQCQPQHDFETDGLDIVLVTPASGIISNR
jgi:DNA invertase Pin-like site-specific DNA recombinase